jgi:hypothetical protein
MVQGKVDQSLRSFNRTLKQTSLTMTVHTCMCRWRTSGLATELLKRTAQGGQDIRRRRSFEGGRSGSGGSRRRCVCLICVCASVYMPLNMCALPSKLYRSCE